VTDDPHQVLLTIEQAAAAAHVDPGLIRQWASRRLLIPAAQDPVRYRESDVLRVERDTRRRARARQLADAARAELPNPGDPS
jgi:DNA-binding transcriptional MerR regulator